MISDKLSMGCAAERAERGSSLTSVRLGELTTTGEGLAGREGLGDARIFAASADFSEAALSAAA